MRGCMRHARADGLQGYLHQIRALRVMIAFNPVLVTHHHGVAGPRCWCTHAYLELRVCFRRSRNDGLKQTPTQRSALL